MPFTPEFLRALERTRERARRAPAVLAVLLLAHAACLFSLALGFALPAVTKGYLIREASAAIGRPIRVESLRLNPFTFTVKASGLAVMEKEGEERFAGFSGLEVDFDPADLLQRRVSVRRFTLVSPSFRLARGADGVLNVGDLIPAQRAGESPGSFSFEFSPENLNFSLSDVRMIGGSLVFDDALTGARHEVKDLHFSMESLKSDRPGLREIFVTGAQVNESSVSLAVKADLAGERPRAEARLHVKDVVFARYTPYLLPFKRPLDMTVDEADLLALVVLPGKAAANAPPELSGGLKVVGVSLANGPDRVAGFGSLEIQGASVDLSGGSVEVERVALDAPLLKLTRDETGALDLLTLFERGGEGDPRVRDVPRAGGNGLALRVGEVAIKNGHASFTDHDLEITAAVHGVRARLTGLDTGAGRFENLEVDAGGDHFKHIVLSAKGGYAPLSLAGKASVEGMDLAKPLPLLVRHLPKMRLAGIVGLKADFSLREHDGEITPEVHASLDVHGLRVAVQGHEHPAFEAHSLILTGIQAHPDARRASIAQVSLSGGRALAAFDHSGRLTALDVLTPGPDAPKPRHPQTARPGQEHGPAEHARKLEAEHSTVPDTGRAAGPDAGHVPKPEPGHGPDWDMPAGTEGGRPAKQAGKAPSGAHGGHPAGSRDGHASSGKDAHQPGVQGHQASGRAGPAPAPPHGADAGHAAPAAKSRPAAAKPPQSGPWRVEAAQFRLASFALEYHDAKTAASVTAEIEELLAKGLSTDPDKPLAVSARGLVNREASFDFSGEFVPKRQAATLKLKLSDLPLPVLAALAGPLPAVVRSGLLTLSGEASASLHGEGFKAAFSGDAFVKALALSGPQSHEPWLSLAGLSLTGASVTVSPFELRAASLILDKPAASLTLDKDGMPVPPFETKPSGRGGAASGQKDTPLAYRVDSVEVRDGRLDITAQGFDTPQKLSVGAITAKAAGVRPGEPARLSLGLTAGHTGTFKAEGAAGWTGKAPVLDLKATLSNMDLGELSAVSARFTGFPITRGKLALELDYKATAKTLDLKNKIVVTGMQLGPKAPPKPGRKDVPLDLALSLLADAKGVIDLDIPVKGAVGQAKIDLGDVISTAVGGALGKIITSPFAFLKVAQGSGETMAVAFAPGSAELSAEAKKSLSTLGEALAKRPRLSLEVLAFADPETESAALAAVLAERHVVRRKAEQGAEAAKTAERKGLFKPRQAAQAPEPRAGSEAAAPPSAPTQADWERLARERQDAVLAYLAGEARLPRERVFPVHADPTRPPKLKDQPGHRAEVKLRF